MDIVYAVEPAKFGQIIWNVLFPLVVVVSNHEKNIFMLETAILIFWNWAAPEGNEYLYI